MGSLARLAPVVLIFVAGCAAWKGQALKLDPAQLEGRPVVGELAPEIEGEDLTGEAFQLSDYRGQVVLLDFWGHW